MLLFSVIVGNGPDHNAMIAFASSPFDHYFGWVHKILVIPVFALSIPHWYNTLVYVVGAFILSFVRFKSILHLCIALMFATLIITGNYRIGLAAIFFSALTTRMPLRITTGSLLHNATIPFAFITLIVPKSFILQALSIISICLLILEFQYLLSLPIATMSASLSTHTDSAAELGISKVSYYGSVGYLVIFFLMRQKSNVFTTSYIIAACYIITGLPIFSRLLIFGKVHFVLHRWSNSKKNEIFEYILKLAMLIITARHNYYWNY